MRRVLPFLFALNVYAQQSAMDPAGPNSRSISNLGLFFLVLLTSIFLGVMVLAVWPLLRGQKGSFADTPGLPEQRTERRLGMVVTGATVATVLILLGLLIASAVTGRATSSDPRSRANSIVIEVTARQWWWSFRYLNDNASEIVSTANEIHIPIGRPVMIRGTSNDVIHSFWVPNLQGKRDLFPYRMTTDWIQADRPGRYRGQCSEFCGLQHAHMAFWVVAETPEQFKAWFAHQLQPASDPTDPVQQRGKQVFLDNACAICHAIGGTRAAGQNGPDLTHFASRLSLAAGTLPNSKGNLAGWIVDPQNVKPGNHMATVALRSEDFHPLLEYLESLR